MPVSFPSPIPLLGLCQYQWANKVSRSHLNYLRVWSSASAPFTLHKLWITKGRKEEDETRWEGNGWVCGWPKSGCRGKSLHEMGEFKTWNISKKVHKKLIKSSWPLGRVGVSSKLRAWFLVGPSHQPVWAGSREPDIYIPLQMCPNSLPALPRSSRNDPPRPRALSSPQRAWMTSVLWCSEQRGWAGVCMRVSVCVRSAPAPSRRDCRPGFTGMQHLASCEPEPDACRPDVGQAPLGGGCTGGSHNLIVRPNPEHITLEYVHHQRYRHKKKKRPQ